MDAVVVDLKRGALANTTTTAMRTLSQNIVINSRLL